ncbi:tRNA pseudouridine(38-40) synthase TruA [Balneola sp. MJW-20]|uniref:tRNA pseudouridine(38-40) synthase TruA n=1 Tax=Gracilimonas aurantiaca TaxID=3234185 RepID=UPI0034665E09
MSRYKLTIEYDGSKYSGWQVQPNALTVEEVLENAFSTVIQQEVDLIGQGRTDAGVHARGQVAHTDLPDGTDIDLLIHRVNGMVGDHIAILEIEKAAEDFHCRFDALGREYVYQVIANKHPLLMDRSWYVYQQTDPELLWKCSELILGEHDFGGFSKTNEDNYTTLCTIQKAEWQIEGERWVFTIKANRFLRNMVRRLVGSMVWVAQGKMSTETFEDILKNSGNEDPSYTAPAQGLILQKVYY